MEQPTCTYLAIICCHQNTTLRRLGCTCAANWLAEEYTSTSCTNGQDRCVAMQKKLLLKQICRRSAQCCHPASQRCACSKAHPAYRQLCSQQTNFISNVGGLLLIGLYASFQLLGCLQVSLEVCELQLSLLTGLSLFLGQLLKLINCLRQMRETGWRPMVERMRT